MALYEQGLYEESMDKWNEVLRLNQMSVLAHDGVGKAYFHAGHYEEAMEHFKVAGNRSYYSEAFWEVRNAKIQKVLPVIFILVVVLFILMKVVSFLDRKKRRIRHAKEAISAQIAKLPVLRDLQFAKKICKSPSNMYYEIRRHRAGSVAGATAIYAIFFVIYMLYQTEKGLIFLSVCCGGRYGYRRYCRGIFRPAPSLYLLQLAGDFHHGRGRNFSSGVYDTSLWVTAAFDGTFPDHSVFLRNDIQ